MDLTHHFLIAMPGLVDRNFSGTLTYVCEHGKQGALGVIVNRPIELTLGHLFERLDIVMGDDDRVRAPVYFGGPVQTDRGFVLHRPIGEWQSTLVVRDDLGLTSSRDILQSFGESGEPKDMLVSLGYAGWAAGQLEQEMAQNAWLSIAADPEVIFGLPAEERLSGALRLLGVELAQLSEFAGHA